MQHSQGQAKEAFELKDAYVGAFVNAKKDGRLTPKQAQDPQVLQASGHIFLDEGKEGVINDGDPSLYYHRGGNTHQFNNPDLRNPLPGGAGERRLYDMDPSEVPGLQNQFDQHQKQLQDQNYGTGNLARKAPVTREEFDTRIEDNYNQRNKHFTDPMTIKHLIG